MNTIFKPGDKVRLVSYSEEGQPDNTPEYGIIVHTWLNSSGDEDCYIAFVGCKAPRAEKPMKPYVLRYYAASLQKGW